MTDDNRIDAITHGPLAKTRRIRNQEDAGGARSDNATHWQSE